MPGKEIIKPSKNKIADPGEFDGKYKKVLKDLKKYTEALKLFSEALSIRKTIDNKMGIVYSLQSIASTHMEMKNFIEAEKTIRQAIQITKEAHSNKKLFLLWSIGGRHDEGAGRLSRAIGHMPGPVAQEQIVQR